MDESAIEHLLVETVEHTADTISKAFGLPPFAAEVVERLRPELGAFAEAIKAAECERDRLIGRTLRPLFQEERKRISTEGSDAADALLGRLAREAVEDQQRPTTE